MISSPWRVGNPAITSEKCFQVQEEEEGEAQVFRVVAGYRVIGGCIKNLRVIDF